ncbi:MAG: T9SS type A sorting domain-containing protein, partial [Bacteroidetes bacterium]|nr:T9SS type A sorting domain-containing protein [Bacteroidota bacterium]
SGGHSNSASQDIYDIWVVKTDSLGDLQWQRCLGGTNRDNANSIQQTDDGGYIVAGGTGSIDGDVTGLHGGLYSDFWIVKLDSVGVLQWQKCLGGTMYEEAYSIRKLVNGNFILAGITSSNDGDVSGLHGNNLDYWIVKINGSGVLIWQHCYGGTDLDEAYSVDTTSDGGFIITGEVKSFDGNVTGNHGGSEIWVVKLNNFGYLQWQKCLGGSGPEWSSCVIQTQDSGYVVYGETMSNDFDVSGNHGYGDLWVVKLSAPYVGVQEPSHSFEDFSVYENLVGNSIAVGFYAKWNEKVNLQLIDITGRILLQDAFTATIGLNKHRVFTGDLVGGIYFLRLQADGGAVTKKVHVQ